MRARSSLISDWNACWNSSTVIGCPWALFEVNAGGQLRGRGMLAQTGRLCATIWLAHHVVSTAIGGSPEGLASSHLVRIADQGSKRCVSPQLARRQEVRHEG